MRVPIVQCVLQAFSSSTQTERNEGIVGDPGFAQDDTSEKEFSDRC